MLNLETNCSFLAKAIKITIISLQNKSSYVYSNIPTHFLVAFCFIHKKQKMHSAENVYHYITKNTFTVLPINSIMKFRVTTEFALFYTHFETGTLRKLR